MAEFGPSGIDGLPLATPDTLQYGDPRVLGWLREAIQDGDRINKSDPSYDRAEIAMRYIAGEQRKNPAEPQLPWLPALQINHSRKVVQAHVSALTDLKPLFGYKGPDAFQFQANLLNQLTVAWWVTTMADLELGNCIKYTLAAGTGDLAVEWDPHTGLYGNHALIAKDYRDTLPIRPGQARDVQLWEGVTFREEYPVNALRGMYPLKAHLFNASSDTVLSTLMGRFRRVMTGLLSPQTDTLSGLSNQSHDAKPKAGTVVLYRTYLTDRTRNQTTRRLVLGDPSSNSAYVVEPGAFLYPRKRLIVSTADHVIHDGPNPYWHGLYPFSRLKLWDLPWQFAGIGLLHDLLPIQDGINDSANDLQLAIKQWTDPTVVYDRGAVGETFMRVHDARRPGAKVKLTAIGGEGYKKLEGPPPAILMAQLQFHEVLKQSFANLSGTANLEQLMELRQMPGAETIQRYYEALTPELRQEGRQVEAFLRPVGEITKVNTFQFMSSEQRIAILGDAGLSLDDFDYDPGSLVPAMTAGEPGYQKELDASIARDKRAQYFHKQFVFTIAPNSLLAMNAQEQKLLRLQLARMGYYDFWSLMDNLEIGNVGTPPKMPLPPLEEPNPQEVLADLMGQAGMAVDPATGMPAQNPATMGMPAPPTRYTLDPATGQVLELRVPQTITERLMAQQLLGIGMTENPAGRKASGDSMPATETKKDATGAPRQTMSESSSSRNGQASQNPASD
jgi:hypothetical protein